jgi:hypothetical protein
VHAAAGGEFELFQFLRARRRDACEESAQEREQNSASRARN